MRWHSAIQLRLPNEWLPPFNQSHFIPHNHNDMPSIRGQSARSVFCFPSMSGLVLMLYQHSLLMLEPHLSERFISLSLPCCGQVDTDVTVARSSQQLFTVFQWEFLLQYSYLTVIATRNFSDEHFTLKSNRISCTLSWMRCLNFFACNSSQKAVSNWGALSSLRCLWIVSSYTKEPFPL